MVNFGSLCSWLQISLSTLKIMEVTNLKVMNSRFYILGPRLQLCLCLKSRVHRVPFVTDPYSKYDITN